MTIDTPAQIEQLIIDMMKTRTPFERLAMVSNMFDTGKALVLAGIRAQKGELTPNQIRIELFRRMYGTDFSEEDIIRISSHLFTHEGGEPLMHRLSDDLIASIRRGERAVVAAALDETPVCVTAVDDDGMTLLHVAVASNQAEIVTELLSRPTISLDAPQRSHGRTPLHIAAIKGYTKLIHLLVDAGVNVFATDLRGLRPLDVAGTPAAIAALRPPTLFPERILKEAIQRGASQRVSRQLCALPELYTTTDAEGRTPLHWAVKAGRIEMVGVLLTAGVPITASDHTGRTPLHEAARKGDIELTRVLLSAEVDPAMADHQGITPLHLAAGHGDATHPPAPPLPLGLATAPSGAATRMIPDQCAFDFAALLPSPPVPLPMPVLSAPLTAGPSRDDLAIATALLDAGADINARARGGVTALHLAADIGDATLVSLLLTRGAILDLMLTLISATPLHLAASRGHSHVVTLLCQAGADRDARDAYGRTLVHYQRE